ncbi:MAG: HAD family phosphatase [Oscillospiraceae bacterium]|nr:HAD family phosphatase [Oscillospiraceae bacterium]
MIKGVIFDMDGTLLDTMYFWDKVGDTYLRQMGREPEPDLGKKMLSFSMRGGAEYLQSAYDLPLTAEEVQEGIRNVINNFYETTADFKPGARQFMERLKALGIPMVLATATDRPQVEAAFRRLGVLEDFQCVLTCSEVGRDKTEPEIYFRAAECMGTRPEDTWVFEDTTHAAATVKRAGFRLAGVYDEASRGMQYDLRDLSDYYLLDFTDFESFYRFAQEN